MDKTKTIRKTIRVMPHISDEIDKAKFSLGFKRDTEFFIFLFRKWKNSPDSMKDFLNH
jgi:hypothetical protein